MNHLGSKARHRMVMDRVCYVCREKVSDTEGVYCGGYGILVHIKGCYPYVELYVRDYSGGVRGKWRPIGKVLEMLEAVYPKGTATP